jgi:small subunit ribosomal protein S6
MRNYELAIILCPELKEEERKEVIKEIEDLIGKKEGKVGKIIEWGKKELAYTIKKGGKRFSEGFYFLFNLELLPETLSEIRKKLRINENILRYLLVKVE